MLHAKFQDHGTSGSVEEDFLRFLPYMNWMAKKRKYKSNEQELDHSKGKSRS